MAGNWKSKVWLLQAAGDVPWTVEQPPSEDQNSHSSQKQE